MTEGPHRVGWFARSLYYVVGIAMAAVAILAASVLVTTRRSSAQSQAHARERSLAGGPRVAVVTAGSSDPNRTLDLLGEARSFFTTTLYAKLSGYLREIRVDRGDRVSENQLLAVIESPETEQQYEAAVADARNRHALLDRTRALVGPGVVSRQDLDQAEAAARIADANQGYVVVQRGYRLLRAPFAGVVTARFADPGALVQSATGSQTGALPIVRISDVDRLRVFVYVDQRDANLIHAGDHVDIGMPDRPDVHLSATVTRTAGELDTRTRTLLTEIDIDNRSGQITPGGFVRVMLRVREPSYPEIPSEALIAMGTHSGVVLVDATNHARLVEVTLVDDDGEHARILTGVHAGDRIALNVGDSVADGQLVQPVPMSTPAHPQQSAAH